MSVSERNRDLTLLVSRCFLAVLFVVAGYGKLVGFAATTRYFELLGLPLPALAAGLAVAIELILGLALVFGVFTRPVALLLALYTVLTALIGHHFWTMTGAAQAGNLIHFNKNLGIAGRHAAPRPVRRGTLCRRRQEAGSGLPRGVIAWSRPGSRGGPILSTTILSRPFWMVSSRPSPGSRSNGSLPISASAASRSWTASKRLAIEGFVTIVPQVGCRLRNYEPGQVEDFFRLFAEGEALVAELAASRATADDVADMRAISARIGRLRQGEMPDRQRGSAYRGLNRALHLRMRESARSPAVAEIVEGLGDRSDFFIALARRPIFAARLEQAHAEHEALLARIADHDAKAAATVIRAHILAIGARLRVDCPATGAAASQNS